MRLGRRGRRRSGGGAVAELGHGLAQGGRRVFRIWVRALFHSYGVFLSNSACWSSLLEGEASSEFPGSWSLRELLSPDRSCRHPANHAGHTECIIPHIGDPNLEGLCGMRMQQQHGKAKSHGGPVKQEQESGQ